MTVNRKGFAAIANKTFISSFRSNLKDALIAGHNEIFVGRVTDIILDSSHPEFKSYGEWNGIGTIFFEAQGNEFVGSDKIVAKPLSPQRSAFPLVDEMVLIFTLPNKEIGQSSTATSYFYINVISIWNSPHHNAYPNPITTSDLPPSQQKDYQQTSAGSTRKVTDEPKEIDLNSPNNPSQQTFREQSNIHPLLPFAGDIIYEGRFGNSIRLGGTANPPSSPPLNNWSNNGENGNPITIIRNGQNPKSSDEGWVPVVENINEDLSSIYVTSNQLIPISVKNFNYESYKTPPTKPDQYKSPQVLINSDRLVFNAKTDSILLSAEKSIFLGTTNKDSSVNIQSPKTVISSPLINLGDKDATEPLVKGQVLYNNLDLMVKSLIQIVDILEMNQLWPGGVAAPDGGTSLVARSTKDALEDVKKDLVNILSKVSKTI
tara:strand:- start:1187 stop:2479 length:1293 start_codon:yes stop_codon:yes gene_type:complete